MFGLFKHALNSACLRQFVQGTVFQFRGIKTVDHHSRGVFASNPITPRGDQFKPNVMKRMKSVGLKTRLQSRGGKQMLWRKILQGPSGWTKFVPAP